MPVIIRKSRFVVPVSRTVSGRAVSCPSAVKRLQSGPVQQSCGAEYHRHPVREWMTVKSNFNAGPTSTAGLTAMPEMTVDTVLITRGDGLVDASVASANALRLGVRAWGGFLLLNEQGRVVRKLKRRSQAELSIGALHGRVTAREFVDITGWNRKRLTTAFPHAFGFFGYRSGLWMGLMISLAVFVVLIVGALVAAAITSAT